MKVFFCVTFWSSLVRPCSCLDWAHFFVCLYGLCNIESSIQRDWMSMFKGSKLFETLISARSTQSWNGFGLIWKALSFCKEEGSRFCGLSPEHIKVHLSRFSFHRKELGIRLSSWRMSRYDRCRRSWPFWLRPRTQRSLKCWLNHCSWRPPKFQWIHIAQYFRFWSNFQLNFPFRFSRSVPLINSDQFWFWIYR